MRAAAPSRVLHAVASGLITVLVLLALYREGPVATEALLLLVAAGLVVTGSVLLVALAVGELRDRVARRAR